MRIKVTKIKGPTHREIKVTCPYCAQPISRNVPIDNKKGMERCGNCGTTFEWEEIKE